MICSAQTKPRFACFASFRFPQPFRQTLPRRALSSALRILFSSQVLNASPLTKFILGSEQPFAAPCINVCSADEADLLCTCANGCFRAYCDFGASQSNFSSYTVHRARRQNSFLDPRAHLANLCLCIFARWRHPILVHRFRQYERATGNET